MIAGISVSNAMLTSQLSPMTGLRQNKNVIITGNTVTTPGLAGLFLNEVQNVQVCNNIFTSTNNLAYRSAGAVYSIDSRYSVLIYDAYNVSFYGNTMTQSSNSLGTQLIILSSMVANFTSDSCSYTDPTIINMYANYTSSSSPSTSSNSCSSRRIKLKFSDFFFLPSFLINLDDRIVVFELYFFIFKSNL